MTTRFGEFALDMQSGELSRRGRKVILPGQAFEVLRVLLRHPGELVSREELCAGLWPTPVHVDFERGLNKAVNKVREVLGDSADSPEYIETVPRHGYRFIAVVEKERNLDVAPPREPAPLPVSDTQLPASDISASPRSWRAAAAAAAILLTFLVAWAYRLHNTSVLPFRSIAVLPLQNLSGDSGQDFFADGMTDELITDLAQIHSLRVISRTSVMQFKQTKKKLPEIADELHVDAIIEGSVLQSNGSVRVTAQLLDARQDRHLWAASYERKLVDIVGLQRQVAQSIADQVRAQITPQEQASLARQRRTNPEAYQAMLRGRFYWNERNPASAQRAILYYQQATELDPGYAEAWAELGGCYASLGSDLGVWPRGKALPSARAAVARALAIDDQLSDGHRELAKIKLWFDWDWKGAESEFRRAIKLEPSDAQAHRQYARYLAFAKRFDEAVSENQQAIDLTPLDTLPSIHLAWIYVDAHLPEKALEQSRRVLARDPGFIGAYTFIGRAYEEQGRWPDAIAAYQKIKDSYSLDYLAGMGHAWAASGNTAEAEAILAQLRQLSNKQYVSPTDFAEIYAALGQRQVALRWLERAYRERDAHMVGLAVDNYFDNLRSDPRFQKMLQLVGFP